MKIFFPLATLIMGLSLDALCVILMLGEADKGGGHGDRSSYQFT